MGIFSKNKLDQLKAREAPQDDLPLVMLVDDEEANRKVMANILRPHFRLIEAADGLAALAAVEQLEDRSQLACIVSDHRMPHLTGVELFAKLQPVLPGTIRIIVTGFIDVSVVIDSINKAEIYKFIVKPFDANDFLLTVQRAVEHFQLQCRLAEHHANLEREVAERTEELARERSRLLVLNEELRRSSERILALYNNASCGYHSLDREGVFLQVNDTELAWLGRSRDELVGRLRFADLVTPASLGALYERYPALRDAGWIAGLTDAEAELVAADGRIVPVLLSAVRADEDGRACSRWTVFDITERKQAEQRIRHMANHDMLTGLPNRALFHDRLARHLALADRHASKLALLFIDLDRFKAVNDQLGHHAGDLLLQQVARRLEATIRKSDSAGRLGGDEFVASLPELATRADAAGIAAKIVDVLARPFDLEGSAAVIGASVGIAVYPDDGATVPELMRVADAAMYRAKQTRGAFSFHGEASSGAGQGQADLEAAANARP